MGQVADIRLYLDRPALQPPEDRQQVAEELYSLYMQRVACRHQLAEVERKISERQLLLNL